MLALEPDLRLGAILLAHARHAIVSAIARETGAAAADTAAPEPHEALETHAATFVTLTQDGALRGCIGTLEAWRPLREDVRGNAVAAASRDPRFLPLHPRELSITRVEVSLLEAPAPFAVSGEADALARLTPFEDGLVLRWRDRRATFLPQVWEQLPDPRDFLRQLRRKAGLPDDFWAADVELERYRVTKWKEPPRAAGGRG